MSFRNTRWFLGIAVGGAIALGANSAVAQITPDTTLPNNSTVTINGNTFNIDGGTTAGRNLFHSFQQFSVPAGNTASFNNAVNIQNIFSSVTGTSVSNIEGIIKASGTANLFLINPNGIIFGPNASLNVGGSFVGTTANAIQFGNQGFFSATNPNNPALLTVNPSVLFFNQLAAASIQNNSVAPAGKDPAGLDALGLRVPDGKSLLLVGGNVNMDRGQLNAYGGRVELGGLAASGNVGLNVDGDKLSLDFSASSTRADVSLTNGAKVYVEAGGGGDIAINSRNLEFSGTSVLSAGIGEGLGNAGAKAGDITLNATGDIKIDGNGILNDVQLQATGNGGNINLSSNSLSLTNGAQLSASTFGQGNAGNVTVNAKDAVSLADNAAIFSTVEAGGVGKGGNIEIKAASLSLTNGARLAASTSGQGNAGNVTVNAKDAVSLADNAAIFSRVLAGGVGKGGNIEIKAASLSLTNGARLTASTLGQGDAGTIKVNAADFFTISDKSSNLNSGLFVNSQSPTGTAGDIIVTSPRVTLDNSGRLDAQSASGNGGNINLQSDLLLLRRGAQITTSAGTAQQGGEGGNITINAPNGFIVSVPKENSDITANAFNGSGGVIQIKALNTYNFNQRSLSDLENLLGTKDPTKLDPQQLPTNDITAISLTSPALSGQVNIITSVFDPNRGLVQLPTNLVDPSKQIAQGCSAFDQANASDFKVTGRGGLPPSPDEPLSSDAVWEDTRLTATTPQRLDSKTTATKPKSESDTVEIIPATGWVFNGKGEVTLVSNGSSTNNLGTTPATCPAR